jgi:hypothetical protein
MIEVKHTCDLCKQEVPKDAQFWSVGINARPLDRYPEGRTSSELPILKTGPSRVSSTNSNGIHCCRACLEERLGINQTEKTLSKPNYTTPTLEDRIIDIISNAGFVNEDSE